MNHFIVNQSHQSNHVNYVESESTTASRLDCISPASTTCTTDIFESRSNNTNNNNRLLSPRPGTHSSLSNHHSDTSSLEIRVEMVNQQSRIMRENSFLEPLVKNPFVHKVNLTLGQKLQLGVGGVFLMPIRLASLSVLTLLMFSMAIVIKMGRSEEDLRREALSGWRLGLKKAIRVIGRVMAFCFGFHRIRLIGTQAQKGEANILVAAPHSSFFDTIAFFVSGMPISVSKAENAHIPVIGKLVQALQPIFVTRESRANKMLTINEIKRRAANDSGWPQIMLFPEGTTTNRSCLITFKPGAFIPGQPVQPVALQYLNDIDGVTWTWQGPNAYKVALLTLCQFNNKLQITYLPVYTPDESEKSDPIKYARNVRDRLAEYLNVPTTMHTYEDCRLMINARERKLPFESGIVEFNKLKEKLEGITFDNVQKLLETFTEYACKSNGKMTLKEFSEYLGLPPTEYVKHVFEIYDRNKDGTIDFREFVIGLSLLSEYNSDETLRLAFKLFDKNDDGAITIDNLHTIFNTYFSMPPEEVQVFFEKIDTKKDGLITYDEFQSFAKTKPEYAKMISMLSFPEFKLLNSNLELNKLGGSTTDVRSNASFVSNSTEPTSTTENSRSTATKPLLKHSDTAANRPTTTSTNLNTSTPPASARSTISGGGGGATSMIGNMSKRYRAVSPAQESTDSIPSHKIINMNEIKRSNE